MQGVLDEHFATLWLLTPKAAFLSLQVDQRSIAACAKRCTPGNQSQRCRLLSFSAGTRHDFESLLRGVDKALYRAKRERGRGEGMEAADL